MQDWCSLLLGAIPTIRQPPGGANKKKKKKKLVMAHGLTLPARSTDPLHSRARTHARCGALMDAIHHTMNEIMHEHRLHDACHAYHLMAIHIWMYRFLWYHKESMLALELVHVAEGDTKDDKRGQVNKLIFPCPCYFRYHFISFIPER